MVQSVHRQHDHARNESEYRLDHTISAYMQQVATTNGVYMDEWTCLLTCIRVCWDIYTAAYWSASLKILRDQM